MPRIPKKEKEGHLKTKTTKFGKKDLIKKVLKMATEGKLPKKSRSKKLEAYSKDEIVDTAKKATSFIKKNYSNK